MAKGKRTEHIKVRLLPSAMGNAVDVLLFPEEKEAIAEACGRLTAVHGTEMPISTFVREVSLWASGDRTLAVNYTDRITKAASSVGMAPGEWMRTIALAVIGYGDLGGQLVRAHQGVAAGLPEPAQQASATF